MPRNITNELAELNKQISRFYFTKRVFEEVKTKLAEINSYLAQNSGEQKPLFADRELSSLTSELTAVEQALARYERLQRRHQIDKQHATTTSYAFTAGLFERLNKSRKRLRHLPANISQESGHIFDLLPAEIMTEIFSYLSFRDQHASQQVRRQFRDVINCMSIPERYVIISIADTPIIFSAHLIAKDIYGKQRLTHAEFWHGLTQQSQQSPTFFSEMKVSIHNDAMKNMNNRWRLLHAIKIGFGITIIALVLGIILFACKKLIPGLVMVGISLLACLATVITGVCLLFGTKEKTENRTMSFIKSLPSYTDIEEGASIVRQEQERLSVIIT